MFNDTGWPNWSFNNLALGQKKTLPTKRKTVPLIIAAFKAASPPPELAPEWKPGNSQQRGKTSLSPQIVKSEKVTTAGSELGW